MKAQKLLEKITENGVLVSPKDVSLLLEIATLEAINDINLNNKINEFKSRFVISELDWPRL